MKHLLVILVLVALGCKGKQPAVQTPVSTEAARPTWVGSRPVTSGYYVGIGLANKNRPDAQETAKKNALNDLASEISVTVEGNSLLYTLDRKSTFDESFTSTIKTSSAELLEGFELVDTYENNSEYWTYYRLSKAEHARIKAERKAKAIGIATDLRSRAKASLAAGDLKGAFDQDLRALIAMKAYWGENDIVELNGVQVPLVNALYSDLQQLSSGVAFSILPERCVLDYSNGFKREVVIKARYTGGSSLVQLPVVVTYPGISGKVTELKNTDTDGNLRTTIQRVANDQNTAPEIAVTLNMDELIHTETDQALAKALGSSLTVPQKRAPIDRVMPKVYMRAQESNLGKPVNDAGAASAIRQELTSNGFRFVDREADCDMLLDLTSTTRQGGESNGFFIAYLDITYSIRDRRTKDVIHEGGEQSVKGVQLTFEKAGLDAYKKAITDLKKELVPGIMNAFN